MPFARIKLGGAAPGLVLAVWLCGGLSVPGAGVTLVTHGNSGNTDGWVTGMANALSQRLGGNIPIYRIDVTNGAGGYGAYLQGAAGGNPHTSASGEIIIKLDWRNLANTSNTTFSVANAVASVLASTNLIPQLGGHALAEFPLHIMGHSRGGSLVCELSQRLGEMGIWVDQVSTLDAYPLGSDAPVRGYENVLFAESYYQTSYFFFDGVYIPNAHRRRQTNADGGYTFLNDWHSDVHLWYHGTINLAVNASDTEQSISSSMRDAWWTAQEQKGTNAGFVYSRAGGGDRYSTLTPNGSNSTPIRDGINQNFDLGAGTVANRTTLMFNTGGWPNVIKFSLLTTNPVPQGGVAELGISCQWAQLPSEMMTVEVWRDADRNPLNGNEQLMQAGTASGTTAGQVLNGIIDLSVEPTNAPVGNHNLFVKLTAAGRSRWLYAPEPLLVAASQVPPVLDITLQAGGVIVGVNGSVGQRVEFSESTDLQVWFPVLTNVLETSRWEIVRPTVDTNEFFRAVLLP